MRGALVWVALALSGGWTARGEEAAPAADAPWVAGFSDPEEAALQAASRAAVQHAARPGQRGPTLARLQAILGEALREGEQRFDPRARPALEALLALDDPDAPRALLEGIERRPFLRRDLLGLLAGLPEVPTHGLLEPPEEVLLRVLRQVLSDPARRYERGLILQLLGRCGDYGVVDRLAEQLERWPDERLDQELLAALNALTGTRHKRARDWQLEWAQEQAPVWRRAEGLLETARAGGAESAQALRQLLKLRDRRVSAAVEELEARLEGTPGGGQRGRMLPEPELTDPAAVGSRSPGRWIGFALVAVLALAVWAFAPRPEQRQVRLIDLRSVARSEPLRPAARAAADPVLVATERFEDGLAALRCLEAADEAASEETRPDLVGERGAAALADGVTHVSFGALRLPGGERGTVTVGELFGAPPAPAPGEGRTVTVGELFGGPPAATPGEGRTVTVGELFGAPPAAPSGPIPPQERTVPVRQLFGPRVGLTRHQLQGLEGLWRCLSEPMAAGDDWQRSRAELERSLAELPLDARALVEQALELLERARALCGDPEGASGETEQAWRRVLGLLYGQASQDNPASDPIGPA